MRQKINFIKTAALDPQIGAVARSSRHVVRTVLRKLEKPGGQALQNIWEYGPGDGAATKEILKLLPAHGQLTVIETNAHFVQALKHTNDQRLRILHGTIQEELPKLIKQTESENRRADAIISSVPFSFFTPRERDQIVRQSALALRDGGKFIVFNQYTPLMFFPIKKHFGKLELVYELRNVPPCFIFSARK